ncbi:MAG: outer membrane protein family [Chthonomonadaceae bacterium]|nr:outer membrane protein family [Chthonomonadaceae bacterium]
MNWNSLRVTRVSRTAASRRASNGLATSDTVLRPLHSLRPASRLVRPALSVFACALLGLATTSHAQTPAPAAAAQAPTTPAAPATPAPPAPGTVTITGLVDVYYGINVRAPRAAGDKPYAGIFTTGNPGDVIGVDNVGHAFDINDRDPSFSLGELNIVRTPGKGFPLGLTVTLTGGDTARIVNANEPGGTASWQWVQQAYLTYTSKIAKHDVTIDFGKFVTPFGAEVIESSSNDEYTRSFGFNYAIPFYHAGIRAAIPITSTLTATLFGVNGWNNVADDNNAKSFIAQLTWKPNAKLTTNLIYMGGAEGSGAFGPYIAQTPAFPLTVPTTTINGTTFINTKGAGNVTIDLVELQPTYQVNSKLKLAMDLVYGHAAGDIYGVKESGTWLNGAAYARYQVTNHFALAGRLEQFEDIPGTGGVGLRLGGGYVKLNSATATAEYLSFKNQLVSRLEYRHDFSSVPFFGAGATAVKDQDTFTLGEVFKF